MAHTVKYWHDLLITEKGAQTALNGLQPAIDDEQTLLTDVQSPSKVAHWRLWAYIVAYAMWLLESFWDLFRAMVEAIIADFRPGTLRWYQEQAFAFQYGYELTWSALLRKYYYATADADAQIIKLCSVTEPGGIVRVKVATITGGNVVAIPGPQLAAVQAYFNLVKYPGKLVCVSFDADLLKVFGTLKFNPLVNPVVCNQQVQTAINGYILGLEFNGRFNITKLIDAVQAVAGVVDFTNVSVFTKYGALAYQAVNDEYQTYAGYAQIDPLFPLSTTITTVPYV